MVWGRKEYAFTDWGTRPSPPRFPENPLIAEHLSFVMQTVYGGIDRATFVGRQAGFRVERSAERRLRRIGGRQVVAGSSLSRLIPDTSRRIIGREPTAATCLTACTGVICQNPPLTYPRATAAANL